MIMSAAKAITGLDDGLVPNRHQAIILTNDNLEFTLIYTPDLWIYKS